MEVDVFWFIVTRKDSNDSGLFVLVKAVSFRVLSI